MYSILFSSYKALTTAAGNCVNSGFTFVSIPMLNIVKSHLNFKAYAFRKETGIQEAVG